MAISKSFALAVVLGLLGAATVASAAEYRFVGRSSAPGNDIDCGQKDSKGNPPEVLQALCKGFDMEGGYCGYLKAAAGKDNAVYTEGFNLYCKVGGGSDCTGDYIMKRRAAIPNNDVDCNAKNFKGEKLSYCEVSGKPVEVAAACSANPNCKAFTTTGSSDGRLKTSAASTTVA